MTLFLPALSARLCMQTWRQSSLAVALACMASVLFSVPTTACSPAMPDSSHIYYAEQNVERLRAGLEEADDRFEDLLYRYRLYPLTEASDLLEDLPKTLDDGTASELAVLSGLWAYRAGEASMLGAIRYGRRSMNLLDAAKERNRFDPFVLLVEGQSLLYRPAIAGRNPAEAATRFEQLRTVLMSNPDVSIDAEEAMIWHWIALREADQDDAAASLHATLSEADLPPLYQQFLESPPSV